ncbi:unnamed protein product [Gordionus sp. m RMFG-2023]
MSHKPEDQSVDICEIQCIDISGCMESDSSNPYKDCLVNEERRLIDERTNMGTVEKKKMEVKPVSQSINICVIQCIDISGHGI